MVVLQFDATTVRPILPEEDCEFTTLPANENKASGNSEQSVILSSAEFVRGFTPPDYLIDGIIQSGFLYSLTGQTGSGKTNVALLFSAHTALGLVLAGREVAKGRVLYFAGENPDDVRMRWIGLCHELRCRPERMDVYFKPGVFSIQALYHEVAREVGILGGVSLIIVDTSAAYFPGDDENGNKQMGDYARLLRTLTQMPGNPAVIAASHPIKGAQSENLVPRGGSGFLNEVDGNLSLAKQGDRVSELHTQGKFRGPDFDPITFTMPTIFPPQLRDSRGRPIPTVMAKIESDANVESQKDKAATDSFDMLVAITANGKASLVDLAKQLRWFKRDGQTPDKIKAQRTVEKLKKDKLVTYDLDRWTVTTKGKNAANSRVKP
ncbi:AAA family ATPase [Mesorhizobium denitrificans]|uniref:Uncharacterized protein n=1 Tax=Mesorhizobium denitrificans TaxID=2294114 RepID=A0A371XEY0_9HYPH|nr:AAA family ATPase [Mesorhizobium denitrificans]RFC67791.1 hypothetical protein DY251_09365 [Mesorhizobium denitrificans]